MKKLFYFILSIILLIIFTIFSINIYVLSFSLNDYFSDVWKIEWNHQTWLVFWASILWNAVPSDILRDRLTVAYEAYNLWIITEIMVSGDRSEANYNEPEVMKNYLLELWVDQNDISLDYSWFDTYDSLYRAKNTFGINDAILFTQDFHLKRAMYISKRLWIETYWVETNLQEYLRDDYNNYREIFARIKAFLEVEIFKPTAWNWFLKEKSELFY